MRIYQHRQQRISKWVLAGLAFLLVMTITFADVYGVNIPSKPGDGNNSSGSTPTVTGSGDQGSRTVDPPPSAVPEPTTIVLMGMGLGAAVLWRSRKKA